MSITLSTDWTNGTAREYSVTLSDGWHTHCDRQRMPRFDGLYSRTFQPRLASRRTIIERVRRAAVDRRPALDVEAFEPLAWLRADVDAGRMPHATATVTQRTRYAPTVRADGRVQYATADVTATGAMVQLERLYRDYIGAARGIESTMAHSASGDGRGTIGGIERIPGAVNGTETRHSPRWKGSKRSLITTTVVARDESTGLLVETQAPVDWRCYSVKRDGTREPFISERDPIKRDVKRKNAQRTAARLATVATTGDHVASMHS